MPTRGKLRSIADMDRQRPDRGQSMIELAIAIPVLLLVLAAVVDIGRLAYTTITLNDAARAGAAYGAQTLVTAADVVGIKCAAYRDAKDITPLAGSADTCTCPDGTSWQCGLTASASTSCECADGSKVKCGDGVCGSGTHTVYVTVSTQAQFKSLTHLLPLSSPMTVSATATRRVGNP